MQHCESPAHSIPVRYSPRLRANWRGTHGHQCRQKQRLSPNFCLLPRLNPSAADHKVDKKRTVLTNFVYSRTQIQLARLLSRTKSPKFEKMFYRQLQIRLARLRSRQKMRFSTEFCLPLRPNPHTAPQSADRIRPSPLHAHPKNPHKKRPDTMPGLISLFS